MIISALEPRLRSNDNHQAVSKEADTHQQVRQRESELQQSNSSLIVVVSIEQKGVLAISLLVRDILTYTHITAALADANQCPYLDITQRETVLKKYSHVSVDQDTKL